MTDVEREPASRVPAVLAGILGQPRALAVLSSLVRQPVHASLLLGPPGSGKLDAACRFAAALLCPAGGCGSCPSCLDALARHHSDLVVVEREGAAITVDTAREVARLALRSPRRCARQVIVMTDLHLVEAAAPALLKTVEEPPRTTFFILIAETLVPALVTVASRCVTVPFLRLSEGTLSRVLVGEGVDPARAAEIATIAGGRLDRARLLCNDPAALDRLAAWKAVPGELDGSGAAVVSVAKRLLARADEPVAVLREAQQRELSTLVELAREAGERGLTGRAAVEARHRREQRRARTDELRAGLGALGAVLAVELCECALSGNSARAAHLTRGAALIERAASALEANPNELLLVESLLLALSD